MSEPPLVDVRDMIVVHNTLLREFRLAPDAVSRVPAGDRRKAAAVDRHLELICEVLHHHHAGEETLLWPPLRSRIPESATPLVDAAEAEHSGIEEALDDVVSDRPDWVRQPDADRSRRLAGALRALHERLVRHLDAEERTILPLAAAYLTDPEWGAIGEAGAAAIPKPAMPLVFGMFAYEGDPEVVSGMLLNAPTLPRVVIPRIAPRAYARRATRIYGTSRP